MIFVLVVAIALGLNAYVVVRIYQGLDAINKRVARLEQACQRAGVR